MKLFKKTALAVALTAAASAPALAADLEFTGDGETIVLADVIFGVVEGTGSEETLITAPEVSFDLRNAANGTGTGDLGLNANKATIKFTLGGGAVFGEDLSTTELVDASNGGVGAFVVSGGTAADNTIAFTSDNDPATSEDVTYEVVQGGAIGDNTITFELTFVDNAVLDVATFKGYAVKNLTDALNQNSTDKKVRLGVEYVESVDRTVDPIVDDVDGVAITATDKPITIFGSQAPVDLVADTDNFNELVRINVGNAEKTFTDLDEDGRADFDPTADTNTIFLGTLTLNLEDVSATTFPLGSGKVRKENGDAFDFQGGDEHTLMFKLDSGALQDGSTFALATGVVNEDCSTATSIYAANTISAAQDELQSFAIVLPDNASTDDLTETYSVCYTVKTGATADVIPEVGAISATWEVDFFNQRYDHVKVEDGDFGPLLRNGCIASFFNVPATGNADTAYIRLTNTSSTNSGDIRGTLYAQDGTILGQDVPVAPELAVHATQIFSTEGADRTTGAGQEVIDIETAFGVDGADYKGRARLVLKGAFDTCEGQGLIRTGGGSLFNMTSTTQGNEAANPNDGNNGN